MAQSSDFVHLHCHSEFSLLDGANRLDPLIQRTAELGMPALAMTDHGVMYGVAEFYSKCKSYGVKPILGVEAYVAPRRLTDKQPRLDQAAYHMVLLAQNLAGYKNLLKLTSIAALEGFYYKPRIDRELLAKYSEGLIGTSACLGGEICTALMRKDYETARNTAGFYRDLFGAGNFYIEIQNHQLPEQIECNEYLLKIARELNLPVICSNDVHYLGSQDASAHDILLCIGTGATVNDTDRLKYATQEFYLKDAEEMKALFREQPFAIERTLEIAERCELELEFGRCPLPTPGIPDEYTPHEYLTQLAEEGLIRKYSGNPPEEVRERLRYELDVIQTTGFSQYILIVRDFAKFAEQKGIFYGVRGSAAGCLTSYLVDITDIDPVEYGLTFERFLNPERVQMPDVDMDFEDARRAEVIDYVTKKYSPEQNDPTQARVAQIITFGTLAARAVLKDAGRALGMPAVEVDKLCKMIPTLPVGMTIDKTLEANPEFKNAYIRDPNARKLIDTAKRLEGISRHASVHAAGVIISHDPLVEYTPLTRSAEGGCVTQYTASMLEKIGLLKMDFLGLINLSILGQAVKNVEMTTGKQLDVRKLPLDDAKTYELLGNGECVGIFQLESPQMRRYIQELKPSNVRDVAAMVALYRPGPMAHIPRFVRCKHGLEKIEYPHAWLENLLKETYGVIVYQDQVMQIAQIIAGYTLGQADLLRRAMGKKKKEEMVKQREKFLEGAKAKGVSEKKASDIFDLMEPFAGYAFNKCVIEKTFIIDAITGERTTVGSLYTHPRPFHVHALGEDYKLRPRPVTQVMANGCKPVFELRTAQGYRITATANHPFRTLEGWINLADLKLGDRIATPRQLRVEGGERWPRHELITLAWLLSEGNTCHPTTLYFYNKDTTSVEDFAAAASCFPDTTARVTTRENGRYVVSLNTGQDSRFRKGSVPWNAARAAQGEAVSIVWDAGTPRCQSTLISASEGRLAAGRQDGGFQPPATRGEFAPSNTSRAGTAVLPSAPAAEPIRSGVYVWAERLGILWKRATEKCLPDAVFRLCDADLELFLGRLWSGDGFVSNGSDHPPYYATSSEELARGVQTLLLRLGITCGVHRKIFKYRGTERIGWTVHLVGENSVETFARRVVPHLVGRDAAVTALHARLDSTRRSLTAADTVPVNVRQWVDAERQSAGLTWQELQTRSGVVMREFYGSNTASKRGFRRPTLRRLAEFFESTRLQQIAQSDIFWDEVVAIEPCGEQMTYDLTVAEDHNFVADGIIVHNSHAVCYAMVAYQTAYLKANYPVEYMAALMACFIEKSDKLVTCMDECKRMGIPVLPPDINVSQADFTVENIEGEKGRRGEGEGSPSAQAIRFGLAAIKNVGRAAVEVILRVREEGGPFTSLTDFCHRVLGGETGGVSRSTMEALIQCGAFASLPGHGNRRALVEILDTCCQSATRAQREKKLGQGSLADMFGDEDAGAAVEAVSVPNIPDYSRDQLLGFERELLGLYISDHPLQAFLAAFEKKHALRVTDLPEMPDRADILLGGIITSIKPFTSKKSGEPMAFFTLEDMTGSVSCTMFPSAYASQGKYLEKDKIVLLRGKANHRERVREDDEGGHIVEVLAEEIIPLAGGGANAAGSPSKIVIHIDPSKREFLRFVRETVEQHRGNGGSCPVHVRVPDGGQLYEVRTELLAEYNDAFRAALERLLGKQTVWVE